MLPAARVEPSVRNDRDDSLVQAVPCLLSRPIADARILNRRTCGLVYWYVFLMIWLYDCMRMFIICFVNFHFKGSDKNLDLTAQIMDIKFLF